MRPFRDHVPVPPSETPRVLVVTNDFPPRVGGVQQYVWNLIRHLPADRVAVLAPNCPGWRDHDRSQPYPVHRWPQQFLWPTADLGRRVKALARYHEADVVLFGHGFPLPLLGPDLRAGGLPSMALTHGAEVWVARSPVLAAAFRRGLASLRVVTAVSLFTARTIRKMVDPATRFEVLHPGVDPDRFSPDADGSVIRERYGLDGRPVVLCVSRLVPRKGQDVLIRALPVVRRLVPEATLVVAGDGPYMPQLERLATRAPSGSVVLAGRVPDEELPAFYAACDVFAMPCRSRWGGLEVEGFGIVFLEASASGRPVVAGRSGGSAEAVADEVTGLLVEGDEPKAVGLAVAALAGPDGPGVRMGRAGLSRARAEFSWANRAALLTELLAAAAD
jgi:phosphatidyl-myo-inositol dimannoside synthase